jgi:hypothetical protein
MVTGAKITVAKKKPSLSRGCAKPELHCHCWKPVFVFLAALAAADIAGSILIEIFLIVKLVCIGRNY